MNSTMIAAAVGGILLGLTGCGESTPPASSPSNSTAGATATDAPKHGCKGQNACKAQGGCKTDAHACKGQNDCKGKGGCHG
jgi:hypothetical protein